MPLKPKTNLRPDTARKMRNAQVIADLRAKLDTLAQKHAVLALTRTTAVDLLTAIAEALGPALRLPLNSRDNDVTYVVDHSAIILLLDLIDAIADLDLGKTDPALAPSAHGAHASLTTTEKKKRRELLALAKVVKGLERLPTQKKADSKLATMLNETKAKTKSPMKKSRSSGVMDEKTRDRSRIGGNTIKSWRDVEAKRKK